MLMKFQTRYNYTVHFDAGSWTRHDRSDSFFQDQIVFNASFYIVNADYRIVVNAYYENATSNNLACAEQRCQYIRNFFLAAGVEDRFIEYQVLPGDSVADTQYHLLPSHQRGCRVDIYMFPRVARTAGDSSLFIDFDEDEGNFKPAKNGPSTVTADDFYFPFLSDSTCVDR